MDLFKVKLASAPRLDAVAVAGFGQASQTSTTQHDSGFVLIKPFVTGRRGRRPLQIRRSSPRVILSGATRSRNPSEAQGDRIAVGSRGKYLFHL